MAHDKELADRIREALATQSAVREVKMFGGLAFMVNDKLVVSAGNGSLLVRVDPQQADELLALEGARRAEMGTGRTMGKSWVAVSGEAIDTDDGFDFWLNTALDYNGREAANRSGAAKRRGRR
ncbi:TfoX/Sxy family protein [Nocardia sp. NPDC051321]|uniref:TfoX/Sxy family protein n=1 Tax=Nocardia sp. NPDC051321 TaxID=3364323 RepID=UPI0037BDCC60